MHTNDSVWFIAEEISFIYLLFESNIRMQKKFENLDNSGTLLTQTRHNII